MWRAMRRGAALLVAAGLWSLLGAVGCGWLTGIEEVTRTRPDAGANSVMADSGSLDTPGADSPEVANECSAVDGGCVASCVPCVHHNDPTIGALLEAARSSYPEIPGIAAAFIAGNDIYLAVRGVRDTVKNVPVQETDAFALWWDSVSLTGTLLAKEVDDGVLPWTMTMSDAFPELFTTSPPSPYAALTVAQLASGTSGLPNAAVPDYSNLSTLIDRRYAFARDALKTSPLFTPGTAQMLDRGPTVAAALLERVVGKSYESLIQDRLLTPLGMKHSKWTPDVAEHTWNGTGIPRPVAFPIDPLFNPQAGICQSIEDFARFAQMSLWLPDAPHYYSADARDALRAARSQGDTTPAFGTNDTDVAGGQALWFNGSSGSDGSVLEIWPNRKMAVVVLTNYSTPSGSADGAVWVGNQLAQNGPAEFPNVPNASFPYATSPTYRATQVRATAVSGANEAVNAFDGTYGTWWAAGSGVTEATLTVDLLSPTTITGVALNEVGPFPIAGTPASAYGIQSYQIFLSDGTMPLNVYSGDYIGPNLEIHFPKPYSGITSASITMKGIALYIGEFHLLGSP